MSHADIMGCDLGIRVNEFESDKGYVDIGLTRKLRTAS
jgi:hypothetical protein